MVHGPNEGHIAPYTDIEFQLTKYQTYIIKKTKLCFYQTSSAWSMDQG